MSIVPFKGEINWRYKKTYPSVWNGQTQKQCKSNMGNPQCTTHGKKLSWKIVFFD